MPGNMYSADGYPAHCLGHAGKFFDANDVFHPWDIRLVLDTAYVKRIGHI